MRRVYTDPRFPGFEVHNEGNVFRVYETVNGRQSQVDMFTTFAAPAGVSEEVAARRASQYFDRMAKGQMSAELLDRPEIAQPTQARQAPEAQPKGDPFGLSASKSLDQMMGDNVLTADDVLDAFEQVKQMPEGPERDKAMAQVQSMSQQLESTSGELVRRLLD